MNDQAASVPVVNHALLFQRLRWWLLRNSWRMLFGQSSLRPLTILACSVVIWAFVFLVSLGGFQVLRYHLPLGGEIVGILLDVLFVALTIMLVFSSGLILYGSLFTSPETTFLLSQPVPADQVFAYKFQGAVAFSSWGFLLLGVPILIAYGLMAHAPWYFYVFLPLFFVGFVLLPGSVGALACLLLVNYLPRQRKQVFLLVVLAGVVLLGVWIYQTVQAARSEAFRLETLNRLMGRFSFASSALAPSHWIAKGLRAAGQPPTVEGALGNAFYYLALVWSNGLFLYLLTAWVAARLYRRGYNRIATGGSLRRRYGGHWLDHLLGGALPFIDPRTRLLIIKDFRTFRRDPQQWAQIVIFSGLMTLYFTNIRRLFLGDIGWAYQNGISLLNLCATSLLLCTYVGRFVYPMLSLEGRKFWILGLLPLERERLLWGKFVFSTVGSLLIAESLVLLSDLMLGMPPFVLGLHALTVAVLAAGLSGLSVGLGAIMPNFRETDPSKIAVGFGGTLNLVGGLGFLLVIIALMAGPWHVQAALVDSEQVFTLKLVWVLLGAAAGLVLGVAAVVVPLKVGAVALRRMEF
jgi:ABC-2 type transport system permease protein